MAIQTQSKDLSGVFIPDDANRSLALAELFSVMFADEQAAFFDHVARLSKQWPGAACFQWRAMEDTITPAARNMLKEMFEHTGPVSA